MFNSDLNLANTNYTNRCLLLSGANGSGKTIYAKQIAIILFLAHIGCYVPAELCTFPILDAINCFNPSISVFKERCNIENELKDILSILSNTTRKSFVIID